MLESDKRRIQMKPERKINKEFVDEIRYLRTRYPNEDYEYKENDEETKELEF